MAKRKPAQSNAIATSDASADYGPLKKTPRNIQNSGPGGPQRRSLQPTAAAEVSKIVVFLAIVALFALVALSRRVEIRFVHLLPAPALPITKSEPLAKSDSFPTKPDPFAPDPFAPTKPDPFAPDPFAK